MKRAVHFLEFAVLVLFAAAASAAHADDLSRPVLLVASDALDGSPFQQTVVLAVPLPSGRHVGFIVNRRTTVKLAALFPQDEPSQKVTEPVYIGGPMLGQAVFALTRERPQGEGQVVPIMPGLFAALDAASVDRVIASAPNDARYFVGLMVWDADELTTQVQAGAWDVAPADADTVLRTQPTGLWKSLRNRPDSEQYAKRGYV
jgi:putative AlgH/UPF0301 family transcriptional regulator